MASVSNSLHSPGSFLEKIETYFFGNIPLSFKSNRTAPSILLFMKKKNSVSVLTNCTFKRNEECIVDFKNRKGWIHFVGIGGSGLSALAKLALKQVSSFFFFFFLGGQNTDLIFCLIAEKVVEKEEILSKIKKSFMFRSLFASFVKNTKRAGLDC